MASDPFGVPPHDPSNPYRSPIAPLSETNLPPLQTGLGSLGQEARLKNLNTAKWIMIIVGLIQMGNFAIFYAMTEKEADTVIAEELRNQRIGRDQIDPVQFREYRDTMIRIARLIYGALIALGAAFVIMGLFVKKYPVPLTITALVLFIGVHAVLAILNPVNLAAGLLLKVIFIVGLAKAIQAAIAYERERKAMATLEYGG
jgi:hypothetical protein